MSFQQQFSANNGAMFPSPISIPTFSASSRKRKEFDESDDLDAPLNIAERRKVSIGGKREIVVTRDRLTDLTSPHRRLQMPLPSYKARGGDQPAMFHPLGAEDNLKMLSQLGLLPGQQPQQQLTSSTSNSSLYNGSNDSPTSALSTSSFFGSSSNQPDGYFGGGHYPNVDPYGPQAAFNRAQEAMEVDPAARVHGPSCTSLPQLYVAHTQGSSLMARCMDCQHSWQVQDAAGGSLGVCYSP